MTDAALYAHFKNKQALYAEMLRESGPSVVVRAIAARAGATETSPSQYIRVLVRDVMKEWGTPAGRSSISIFMHELANGASTRATLFADIDRALDALSGVFAQWRARGALKAQFDDRHLAWELFAPLVYIRLVYLNAHAKPSELRAGLVLAEQHVEAFVAHVL